MSEKKLKVRLIYQEKDGSSTIEYFLVEDGRVVRVKSDPAYYCLEIYAQTGERLELRGYPFKGDEFITPDMVFERDDNLRLFN